MEVEEMETVERHSSKGPFSSLLLITTIAHYRTD